MTDWKDASETLPEKDETITKGFDLFLNKHYTISKSIEVLFYKIEDNPLGNYIIGYFDFIKKKWCVKSKQIKFDKDEISHWKKLNHPEKKLD